MTPRRRFWCLALLVSLLGQAPSSVANDAVFGGTGSDLHPLAETRVQMVSEDIVIDGMRGPGWFVTATYRFKNKARDPVQLQVGFPEFHCDEGTGVCDDYRFSGLKTLVDGVEVPTAIGTIRPGSSWGDGMGDGSWEDYNGGRVFTFEMSFAPDQEREVVHTYRFNGSTTSMQSDQVAYITTTGALWNGPIGHARFTLRTWSRPMGISWPKSFLLVSQVERLVKGRAASEYVFEMKNWTPTEDLWVTLWHSAEWTNCPLLEMVFDIIVDRGVEAASLDPELYGNMTPHDLRICRNLYYARHGYRFKNPTLYRFFYENENEDEYGGYWRGRLTPNPHFTPALLSTAEWLAIQAIRTQERRLEEHQRFREMFLRGY